MSKNLQLLANPQYVIVNTHLAQEKIIVNKKNALYALAVVLVLVGIVWTLQGSNILPGSFMTGRAEWFVAGVVSIVIGVFIVNYARKQGNQEQQP